MKLNMVIWYSSITQLSFHIFYHICEITHCLDVTVVSSVVDSDINNHCLRLFQTLSYDNVLESVMPRNIKDFYLTDDTGHVWSCTVAFVRSKEPHYKIEGEWKHFCSSRGLTAGTFIRIGASKMGANISFFVTLKF